jgi:hypothetical protein
MKAVDYETHFRINFIDHFNEVHETKFKNWDYYYEAINFQRTSHFSHRPDEERKKEYEAYLNWVELQNSPLMEALK